MTNLFRIQHPKRTYSGIEYKGKCGYQKYKTSLREDFNNRCGYTDCSDKWFGYKNGFHIDHFKPKKQNPHLLNKYSNLVYSCPHVNGAKWHKWNDLYIDPVEENFNNHFERNINGEIKPISQNGEVMYQDFKLYLSRYSIIWRLEQIDLIIKELDKVQIDTISDKNGSKLGFLYQQLHKKYNQYEKYLNQ